MTIVRSSRAFAVCFLILLALAPRARCQIDWSRVELLPHVAGAAGAFDTARGELVVFGGTTVLREIDATWSFDGVQWRREPTAGSPSPRQLARAAFDPLRGVVVLFGGVQHTTEFQDTWEWDGTGWTQRLPVHAPGRGVGHAMTWDAGRQRVLLFGPSHTNPGSPETWEWDGADWLRRGSANWPDDRSFAGIAYDPLRDRVVLFGGEPAGPLPLLADAWEWDGLDWTRQRRPVQPPVRSRHGMAWDAARGRVVVHGGMTPLGNPMGDTWEWDGSTWTQGPSSGARFDHVVAADPARARLLAFGGRANHNVLLSDAWALEATWRQLHPGEQPPATWTPMAAAACDGTRGTAVWFGGEFPPQQTWEWNGERWWLVAVGQGPSNAQWVQLCWLPALGTIAHVPRWAHPVESTWVWDGAWRQLAPARLPGVDSGFGLALDPGFDRLVLFGGLFGGSPGAATWTFDGVDWTQVTPATSPPPRQDHAMVLDPARARIVLFGGIDGTVFLDDTWEWDGSTWTERLSAARPAARSEHVMAFDHGRRRTVLHGGRLMPLLRTNDTWEWDGTDWTLRATAQAPSPVREIDMVADPQRGAVLLHGAYVGGTWRLEPVAAGSFTAFGAGCDGGGSRVPVLFPELGQRPYAGSTLWLVLADLPGAFAFATAGSSNTTLFGVLPLPLDLAPLGHPGCALLVQPEHLVLLPLAGGVARWPLTLPANAPLVGARFYVQAFAFDATGRAAATAGGEAVIGGL